MDMGKVPSVEAGDPTSVRFAGEKGSMVNRDRVFEPGLTAKRYYIEDQFSMSSWTDLAYANVITNDHCV